jgi:hypothetical protein
MITSILIYVSVFGLSDHCSLNMAKPLTPTLIGCIFLMNLLLFNFFSVSDVSRGSIVSRFAITFQLLRAFVTPFLFLLHLLNLSPHFSAATPRVGSRIITGFLPIWQACSFFKGTYLFWMHGKRPQTHIQQAFGVHHIPCHFSTQTDRHTVHYTLTNHITD